MPRWCVPAALSTFVVAFVTLTLVATTERSATWDEPIHLTAGYVALTRLDVQEARSQLARRSLR